MKAMAKVTITIEDGFKDGRPTVKVNAQVDRQGLAENAPATDAMLHGLNIIRMWDCGSLPASMRVTCVDALQSRDAILKRIEAAKRGAGPAAGLKVVEGKVANDAPGASEASEEEPAPATEEPPPAA